MSFLDKPTLSADNGSFFQKNLVYQTEKPTLSEINLLYLIIVTTACHRKRYITAIKDKIEEPSSASFCVNPFSVAKGRKKTSFGFPSR